jgi:glycerol kinase
MPPIAAAIDLGTTRVKGALLGEGDVLLDPVSRPAPRIRSGGEHGERRESSVEDYLQATSEVLEELARRAPAGLPLGMACQRSSFAIWERAGGRARTPLISWQDRRAAEWCDRHAASAADVTRITGIRLSPHYAGAKLAHLVEERPELGEGLVGGELMFGTLDALVLWHWSDGGRHETDLTIAARTMLADPRAGRWSEEMLQLFGVSETVLPTIAPTTGRTLPLATTGGGSFTLAASVADQAAAALAVLGASGDAALVNLGTGGFVLRSTGSSMIVREGYLAGAMFGAPATLFALEGAINGIADSVDRYGALPTPLPSVDPTPDAFCLPDSTGTGSPYWRVDGRLTFSDGAAPLDDSARRRIVLEGVVFRVREILADLFEGARPSRVLLSGGIARDPFVAAALAGCLETPVHVLEEREVTLLGAARLAAGCGAEAAAVPSRRVEPGEPGRYLASKFGEWKGWLDGVLVDAPGADG